MAQIAPFRGIRYSDKRISDLRQVVIPPYDVITPEEQELFHHASPYSMVRLELGKPAEEDSEHNNPHTRAARYLEEWQAEEILVREETPCIYYYELEYSLTPQLRQTRYGFICALRLEDFRSGGVRPHERTFQNVKDERLRLMLACHANLSPIFALYSDRDQVVDSALRSAKEPDPVICYKEDIGMEHKIWRVCDTPVLKQVAALMEPKTIFIADGHHRYETGLNYRTIQRERLGTSAPHEAHEYIMMYLSNMNDGGLTILPTHRMLRNLDEVKSDAFLEAARAYFEISRYEMNEAGKSAWEDALREGGALLENIIGFCRRGGSSLYLLKAKPREISAYLRRRDIPEELHGLDVVVVDQVILRNLLGLSEAYLADEKNIHFKHNLVDALSLIRSGDYQAGFFINHTRIEQVQEVASAGLIMPHKSTYFYPKVGSGLVIRLLGEDDRVVF